MMHPRTARARISSGGLVMVLSIVALVVLIALLVDLDRSRGPSATGRSIRLFCAAGVRPPVEAAARAYERTYGVRVEMNYGGSGTLLSQIEVHPDGADLYLSADDSYVDDGRARGLLREAIPVAEMRPVIAVPRGNPRGIRGIDDLLTGDLSIGIANPESAAIGRVARTLLESTGRWDDFATSIVVTKPTVTDVANDLKIGAIDASILWDATVAQYDEIDAIIEPTFEEAVRTVAIGVVAGTDHPTDALRFARWLASRDRGAPVFERFGYEPAGGDRWAPRPRLLLYAGSMFNQAIETTLRDFEVREGVQIDRVYNGCGILVAQMRAGAQPDAYLSCDVAFLDLVSDRFRDRIDLTENPMVLATLIGNPHGVLTVADLAKPGLKVGLAHPEKSALGHLTQALLERSDALIAINDSGNWVQDAPQGDFLINALRTRAIDAAIIYRSNAAFAGDDVTVIEIDDDHAIARQPYVVAIDSEHAHTMQRLRESLASETSAQRFRDLGFRWLGPDRVTAE